MVRRASPSRTFRLTLADGRLLHVAPVIASRVRGVDADGDVLVCDEDDKPADGTDYLTPLTPCCHATGKGVDYSTTYLACRHCRRDVDPKYGTDGQLAVGLAATTTSVSTKRQAGEVLTFSATATSGPNSLALIGSHGRSIELIERLRAATANSGVPAVHCNVAVRVVPYRQVPCAAAAAIAVAAIAVGARIPTRRLDGAAVLGDVGLDGSLRATGDMRAAIKVARGHGLSRIIVPTTCVEEIGEFEDLEVLGAHRLADVAEWLRGDETVLHNPRSAKPRPPTGSASEHRCGPLGPGDSPTT